MKGEGPMRHLRPSPCALSPEGERDDVAPTPLSLRPLPKGERDDVAPTPSPCALSPEGERDVLNLRSVQQFLDDLSVVCQGDEVALVGPDPQVDPSKLGDHATRRGKRCVLVVVAMPPRDRRLDGRRVEVPAAVHRE